MFAEPKAAPAPCCHPCTPAGALWPRGAFLPQLGSDCALCTRSRAQKRGINKNESTREEARPSEAAAQAGSILLLPAAGGTGASLRARAAAASRHAPGPLPGCLTRLCSVNSRIVSQALLCRAVGAVIEAGNPSAQPSPAGEGALRSWAQGGNLHSGQVVRVALAPQGFWCWGTEARRSIQRGPNTRRGARCAPAELLLHPSFLLFGGHGEGSANQRHHPTPPAAAWSKNQHTAGQNPQHCLS